MAPPKTATAQQDNALPEAPKPLIDVTKLTDEIISSSINEYKVKIHRKIVQLVQVVRQNEANLNTAKAGLLKFQEEVNACTTEDSLKVLIGRYAI